MFHLEKNNKRIGAYIKKLIERKYSSHRQFCGDYLRAAGMEANNEELRKMGNRISQIIKGNKAIQVYDLPIFTDLLGVSCEEILSCGKHFVPVSNHITNYEVAFSKDRNVWEKYVNREDKLILNYDEYGKSVIDYAFDFKNYAFLKFLMDEEYIWLVDNSAWQDRGYMYGYGAGTSIKRRDPSHTDSLVPLQVQYEDRLRTQTIALAIENEDYSVLDKLCARENPALHKANFAGFPRIDLEEFHNDDLINAIALSKEEVLDYFSEEFEVTNLQKRANTFIFPYIGEVIECMLQDNRKEAEILVRRSIHHNKKVYEQLKTMIGEAYRFNCDCWGFEINEDLADDIMERILYSFNMDESSNIVSFHYHKKKEDSLGLVTNIVKVADSSGNCLMDELITELNDWYQKIISLKTHES